MVSTCQLNAGDLFHVTIVFFIYLPVLVYADFGCSDSFIESDFVVVVFFFVIVFLPAFRLCRGF